MQKKKYSGMIVVALMAMLIGLIIAVQMNTTQGSYQGGLVPVAKLEGYAMELQQVRTERDSILQELIALEARMEEIERDKADDDFYLSGIMSELERYRMAAGVVDVVGPGITITISDPDVSGSIQGESTIMYNYELILSLVNKLKDAAAEAISINGQRITSTTEISLAGDNLNINRVATAPPYTIKAIGNPDTLEGALTIRFGIVEVMKSYKYNLKVDIKKSAEVTVPRYSDRINFRYATPVVKEGEE